MQSIASQRGLDAVSVSHPKTEERIADTADYLERHYATLPPAKLQTASWKAITCTVHTPEWKRECQAANKTPAGRATR